MAHFAITQGMFWWLFRNFVLDLSLWLSFFLFLSIFLSICLSLYYQLHHDLSLLPTSSFLLVGKANYFIMHPGLKSVTLSNTTLVESRSINLETDCTVIPLLFSPRLSDLGLLSTHKYVAYWEDQRVNNWIVSYAQHEMQQRKTALSTKHYFQTLVSKLKCWIFQLAT